MDKDNHLLRYQELLNVKGNKKAKIDRGQDFEELINDVFADEKILYRRSYHTYDNRSEQIDGAIWLSNRMILFEVKWVAQTLPASELYAFSGKVDNKLSGTLGLFISKNELSDNFVSSISKGRKRNVLIIHGNDIDLIFEKKISLVDYISDCIRLYSCDNLLHYTVEDWLSDKANVINVEGLRKTYSSVNKDIVNGFLNGIFQDSLIQKHQIEFDIEDLGFREKCKVCEYLLREYPRLHHIYIRSLRPKSRTFENVDNSIRVLIESAGVVKETYSEYYNLYISKPSISYLGFMWDKYKDYYSEINMQLKNDFNNKLYDNFGVIVGSYDKENTITNVVEYIWEVLGENLRGKFLEYYLEIFFSSRKDHYEQKRFALKIVNDKNNAENVKKWLEKKIVEEIENNDDGIEDIEKEVNYFDRIFCKAQNILDFDDESWFKYLKNTYRKNIK